MDESEIPRPSQNLVMDADTIDLCKENIQPLRQGRRANKLGLALLAQRDSDIQEQLLKEREQHELEIMTYDGPDPLEPRYAYVHWIEQSCLKNSQEVNLIPLLEDTIMLFKEDDRYKQDNRFIELIVKYIEKQDNPIELFQMVYAQEIGTKCAAFYKAWSDQLDMNCDFQRADHVFQLGLQNGAEPKEVIEEAHMRFQMSVGRRMMTGQLPIHDKTVSDETAERQRKVLGRIKKGGTHRNTSVLPGKLPLSSVNRLHSANSASTFAIYKEDENGLPIVKSKAKLSVNAVSAKKENTMEPSPWNQGFKQRPVPSTPSTPVPSTPTFKVLRDEDDETPSKPAVTPVPANVLKIRKAEMKHHAEELFKSPHPSAKPHLPLFEAFAGGKEFSFEELRWAYLCKKSCQKMSDETPVRVNRLYTPGKSSMSVTSPVTPLGPVHPLEFPDRTPSVRPMDPILESPTDQEGGHRDVNHEMSLGLQEADGVYVIPNTPANPPGSREATDETSTSGVGPIDTPLLHIISRPKIVKPKTTTSFKLFTDD